FPRQKNCGSAKTRESESVSGFLPAIYKEGGGKNSPKKRSFPTSFGRDPKFLRYFQFREQATNACSVLDGRNKRIQRSAKGATKEPKGTGRERERTGKRTGARSPGAPRAPWADSPNFVRGGGSFCAIGCVTRGDAVLVPKGGIPPLD